MKNLIKSLVKSLLIPSGLTKIASAADAQILKIIGLGMGLSDLAKQTKISNEEMNGAMRIVKTLKKSVLLIKDFSK